jgi:hypothetical protein
MPAHRRKEETAIQGAHDMTSDARSNSTTDDNSGTDKESIIADPSFLDGLHSDTLQLVALIMRKSTGQKNIFHQLKLHAPI